MQEAQSSLLRPLQNELQEASQKIETMQNRIEGLESQAASLLGHEYASAAVVEGGNFRPRAVPHKIDTTPSEYFPDFDDVATHHLDPDDLQDLRTESSPREPQIREAGDLCTIQAEWGKLPQYALPPSMLSDPAV